VIGESAQALLELVQTVPALASSSGLMVGANTIDPQNIKLPLPAAWVLYVGDKPDAEDGNLVENQVDFTSTFFVMVFVPTTSQADLRDVQYPLIQSVIGAIQGQLAPNGNRFSYRGQSISNWNQGRLTMRQTYHLRGTLP
jgi:hypothetical protein